MASELSGLDSLPMDLGTPENPGGSPLEAKLVELEIQRRQLESELEEMKKRAAKLQAEILERWLDAGIQNMKIAGRSVYIRHDFYCNKRPEFTQAQICDELVRCGLSELVTTGYNASALKARVREMAENGQVPPELMAMLNFDSVPKVVVGG